MRLEFSPKQIMVALVAEGRQFRVFTDTLYGKIFRKRHPGLSNVIIILYDSLTIKTGIL